MGANADGDRGDGNEAALTIGAEGIMRLHT